MRRLACLMMVATLLPFAASCREETHPAAPSRSAAPEPGSYEVIANAPLEAHLDVRGKLTTLHGRASLYVRYSPRDVANGLIEVRGLNVTFFEVPQEAISGRAPRADKAGLLSLGLMATPERQLVKYDRVTHAGGGNVQVVGYFTQLDELLAPPAKPGSSDATDAEDYTLSPTLPGSITLTFALGGPPQELTDHPGKGNFTATASIPAVTRDGVRIEKFSVSMAPEKKRSRPTSAGDVTLDPLQRTADASWHTTKVGYLHVQQPDDAEPVETLAGSSANTRSVPQLCIQPYLVPSIPTSQLLTQGMAEADQRWTQTGGAAFDVQPAKQLAANFEVVLTGLGGKTDQLQAAGNIANCIEVFFIHAFAPPQFHMGANTYRGGQGSAKVVIAAVMGKSGSVEIAQDPVVLAHELGHVLNLKHPLRPGESLSSTSGSSQGFPATKGTLMCPAHLGVARPSMNSSENLQHLSNPLASFVLQKITRPADCPGGSSCGSGQCPEGQ